jgi:putative transposase
MSWYERRLPHWDVTGKRMFVTFRLHGSLPVNRVFPNDRLTAGEAFVAMDRLLDRAKRGPMFLRQPEIAEIVINSLYDGEQRFGRYELHAFVVMANHVHLLVTPFVPSRDWLGPLKGFTGHEAKCMLGLQDGPFWQDESYDHLIRNDAECAQVKRYIEWNPVKAGLAVLPEEFPFSSATPGRSPAAGRKAWPHMDLSK